MLNHFHRANDIVKFGADWFVAVWYWSVVVVVDFICVSNKLSEEDPVVWEWGLRAA